MGNSLIETLRFGEQSQSHEDTSGFRPVSMHDFLAALHQRNAFTTIDSDGDQLQSCQTTWGAFASEVALNPHLGLDLQPLETVFDFHPSDMPMVEFGHNQVLGLVGAVGADHQIEDASTIVALDLAPVGYDLPERHRGEEGVVRPMRFHVCGLVTSSGTYPTQRLLMVTYELAALRPQTLAHQIGTFCEAREFALSIVPPNQLTLEELGLRKGMRTTQGERKDTLPYLTTLPINGCPMITECMKKSIPGQTHMIYGTITHEGSAFKPQLLGSSNIQVFPGTPENNNQIHIITGYQSHFFFPAFLRRSQ